MVFLLLTVAPFLRSTGSIFGLDVASGSTALAAGLGNGYNDNSFHFRLCQMML